MKKYKLIKWWKLIILDTLALAVGLSVFCYFHHIKHIWGIGVEKGENVTMTTLAVFTKPTKPSVTTGAPVTTKPGIVIPGTNDVIGSENSDNSGGTTGEPITPPVFVDQGDFGASFPEVFADEGEYITTDNSYVSHDINITYERRTIKIDGKNVVYYYYDVYIRNIENLYTVSIESIQAEKLDKLEEMGAKLTDDNGNLINDGLPVLSMNGDLWKRNKVLIAERNGVLYAQSNYINNDIGVLYYDGTFEVVSPDKYNFDTIANKAPYQIWYFGPGLLDENGNPKGDKSNDYKIDGATYNSIIGLPNPRAAIGYFEPGHYAFVVVDGRCDFSAGCNVPNLAKIMSDIGCKAAYNLDGGKSAQVKFNGEYQRMTDQDAAQRKIDDIICIGEVFKYD